MFYEHPSFERENLVGAEIGSALITFTPAESKRLIAKAVAVLPEVKAALQSGTLIINWGTTNAFVAEEITGNAIPYKTDFASGVVSEGELNSNHPDIKIWPVVLRNGKPCDVHQKAALQEFEPDDVFIKGANAVDVEGNVGICVGNLYGGSVVEAWFAVSGRKGVFICPVGLEKLISSPADEAARHCGFFYFKYSMGVPVSLVTFRDAKVVTEIQAIKVLTGADAIHVASGGIAGSEGAVTLVLEADLATLERAFNLLMTIKGEPPVSAPRRYGHIRAAAADYDARAILMMDPDGSDRNFRRE